MGCYRLSLLVLETIAAIDTVSFLVQFGRKKSLDAVNVSLMVGFICMGAIAYIVRPQLTTTVELLSFYSPHAYNLIIWPLLSVALLRKRFQPKHFFLAFVFIYGLDELLWNSLAMLRYFGDWHTLAYFFSPGFLSFFGILCGAVAVSYYFVRLRLSLNPTWLMLTGFAVFWAWVADFPIIAVTNPNGLSFQMTLYLISWELMWQAAYWVFVWASVKPREA